MTGARSAVRYAKGDGAYIAYRLFGDGPRDIVLVPGTISHVELFWDLPSSAHLLKRLTAFARVIVFDKRGQGLSDRVGEQTLEERVRDVHAVMDAAGSERATVYGWSEGGPLSLTFAASHPERTDALIVYGSFASMKNEPWALSPALFARYLEVLENHWGEGVVLALNAPSLRGDQAAIDWFGRIERAGASPGSILTLLRANYEIDVRDLLPSISAPTLILHRAGDRLVPVTAGRYLAEHIPGARFVEIPGSDHLVFDAPTQDVIADEIEEFMTGSRRRLELDRVLATLMFVDMVDSTWRAAELGDARWLALLERFYQVMSTELATFHGHEVDRAGDGLLARFDGPARAIRCALSARERLRELGIQVRVGIHTGECEWVGDRLGGIALHIGARIASRAAPGELLVSGTVKDLVAGSGLAFDARGSHPLKGVPGEWTLYAVAGPPAPVRQP